MSAVRSTTAPVSPESMAFMVPRPERGSSALAASPTARTSGDFAIAPLLSAYGVTSAARTGVSRSPDTNPARSTLRMASRKRSSGWPVASSASSMTVTSRRPPTTGALQTQPSGKDWIRVPSRLPGAKCAVSAVVLQAGHSRSCRVRRPLLPDASTRARALIRRSSSSGRRTASAVSPSSGPAVADPSTIRAPAARASESAQSSSRSRRTSRCPSPAPASGWAASRSSRPPQRTKWSRGRAAYTDSGISSP